MRTNFSSFSASPRLVRIKELTEPCAAKALVSLAADEPDLPNLFRRIPWQIAALACNPADWATIAIRGPIPDDRDALWKQLVESDGIEFGSPTTAAPYLRVPGLEPSDTPIPSWKQAALTALETQASARSKVDLTALVAGILQIGDHLTASHEHAQEVEGRGRRRAGDYWHAINHRREPDDFNAKYWFRKVGDHPVLPRVAEAIPVVAKPYNPIIQEQASGLLRNGQFDPFAFVDLASKARTVRSRKLDLFVESIQWIEMVYLLEATIEDAFGE